MASKIVFNPSDNNSDPFQIGRGSFNYPTTDQAAQNSGTNYSIPLGAIADAGTAPLIQAGNQTSAQLTNSNAALTAGYQSAYDTADKAIKSNAANLNDYLTNNTELKNLNVFSTTGQTALDSLSGLVGLKGAEAQKSAIDLVQNSPAYQFQMNQGLDAIQNSYAARGLLNSTALAKELTNYASGAASNAIQNQVANLTGIVQQGQSAAAQAATNAASLYQSQLAAQTSLQQQQIANQVSGTNAIAQNTSQYQSALDALTAQLSAQQQQLSIARSQLSTQQYAQQQQALMNRPDVQMLIQQYNTAKGAAAYNPANNAAAADALKKLQALGVEGY